MLVTLNTRETGMLTNKRLQAAVLDTVGINGLDTQTHPTALDPEWFTKADNIVYTEGGKVTFRKGVKQMTTNQDEQQTPAETVEPIGALVEHKLSGKVFASANGYLYEIDLTNKDDAFLNRFDTGSGAPNWEFIEYDDEIYCFQRGSTPVEYDNTTGWALVASKPAGVTTFDPNCGLGHYGRVWAGGLSEDKNVLYYTQLETPQGWSTGDSGYIDLKFVWGGDEIVALHAFGGKLVVFGRQNIAIYNDPWDVANMYLDEVIEGVGCVSRDSIQAIGNDLFFVSDTGVRSLQRTALVNNDKLPLQEISLAVKDEMISHISNSTNIKSVFVIDEGLYVVSFVDLNVTYVLDITYKTPRGTPRITKWHFEGDRHPKAMAYSEGYGLLFGQQSGNVCSYEGYHDVDYEGSNVYTYHPFTGSFSTVWIDLGQGYLSSILKKMSFVVSGGQGTDIGMRTYKDFELTPATSATFKMNPAVSGTEYKWGGSTSLFGAAKYAPIYGLKEVGLQLAGDAKYLRFEMDGVTNGYKASLQSITLFYKQGKQY